MALRTRQAAKRGRGGLWRHWTLWVYFPLALLVVAGYVFVLKSGKWLVVSDPFEKAAWATVLAGESREAERADEALRLYLDGRIDSLIYSSNRAFKRRWSSEFLAAYLAEEGYPREKIFEFRQEAFSTLEEARLLIRQFRWQNLDTVVIITSSHHTARSRRIFRKLAQGYPHILVHSADYAVFDPSAWWSSREGRKVWLLEWTKTVSTWFELLGTPPEVGKAESNALIGGIFGTETSPALPASAPVDTLPAVDTARADTALSAPDSLALPAAPADTASQASARPDEDTAARASAEEKSDEARAAAGPAKESAKQSAKESTRGATAAKETAKEPAKPARAKATATKATATKSTAKEPARKTTDKAEKASEKEKSKEKKKTSR